MADLSRALAVFREHWKHPDFRKYQRRVIEAALDGDDVLAVLPTGAGKSACFQVPTLCKDGGAIVISPLISLMKDQVDDCLARGIPATFVNSSIDEDEMHDRYADFQSGTYQLFYVAPERIRSKVFVEAMQLSDVSYIVVDEAHCCSQWGHDFRPDYMRIFELVSALTGRGGVRPPIIAVTATATPRVVEDIATALGLDNYVQIVADPVRPNLDYIVERWGRSWDIFREWVRDFDVVSGRHVVYAGTRAGSEKLAGVVKQEHGDGLVAFYHAGMKPDERTTVQEAFKSGEKPVVCATTAFGMGIDVASIRTVVNFGIPGSLEDYMQQTGRAGRDGKPSKVVLITDQWGEDFQHKLVENANPPWPYYSLVWEWLHRVLKPGETLRQTLADMAQDITSMRLGSIDPEQVGVVLSRMHSKNLIERRSVDAGTPITVDAMRFRALLRDETDRAKPVIKNVWRVIWSKIVDPELRKPTTEPRTVLTVYVNRKGLTELAECSQLMVRRALEALKDRKVALRVGDTYTGKTVKILEWRADLDDHLPRELIEEKRACDQARLRRMIDYTKLRRRTERVEFLQRYFLRGDEVAAPE